MKEKTKKSVRTSIEIPETEYKKLKTLAVKESKKLKEVFFEMINNFLRGKRNESESEN